MIVVRLTPLAEAELEAIADYIARDNPRRALSFVQELRDRCLSLVDMPLAFPLVPRYEDRGIRHRVHGNYLDCWAAEAIPRRITICTLW